MAQDELRSLQAAQGLPDYCRAAALASWQSLAAQGALAWADSHVDTRGRDLAYAGACVCVCQTDIGSALQRHHTAPLALKSFFHQEA